MQSTVPGRERAVALARETTRSLSRAAVVSRLGPLGLVAAVVVVGNLLYVLGIFDPSPITWTSGLGVMKGALLPGAFTIDPNAGTTALTFGHLAATDLLHGTVPWWNPYEGIGAPLAGEMQSAALFPPTLLLALPGGQLAFHMLLEAVAGMATYALLLRLDVSRWIAAAGGCAFALNGTYSWFAHAAVNPVAFLPVLLLGVERARAAAIDGRRHRWGLIAVALALSVYAGFPETAFLDGLLAAVWALARLRGLERVQLVAYGRKLAAGLAVGALLAAPIAVAFADYLHAGYVGAHSSGFDGAALPRPSVGALFFPYLFGPIFGFVAYDKTGLLHAFWGSVGGYLTTTLLVFDLVALWSRRLRVLRLLLVAWIVVAIGRIYGITPLRQLFDLVPLMDKVAAYRYLPPSLELACVVLAVLGIDDLRRRETPLWFVGAALGAAAAAALLSLDASRTIVHALAAAPNGQGWLIGAIVWGFGTIAAVAVAAVALSGRARAGVLAALLVVDAMAMFVVPEFSAPRQDTVDTALVRWIQAHDGTGRIYSLGVFNPNYGSYFRVGQADVNDLPLPKAYAREIVTHLDPNVLPNLFIGSFELTPTGPTPLEALEAHTRSYEAIGVRYVVGPPGAVPPTAVAAMGLTEVYADRVADVYRLPRPEPLYSVTSGSCTLSHARLSTVTADCRGGAVLVRRELAMAGWTATAGGRAVPLRTRENLFQSVRLGRGTSVVTFSFVPPHEGAALGALLAGLIALVAGWWRARRPEGAPGRRRRRGAHAPARH